VQARAAHRKSSRCTNAAERFSMPSVCHSHTCTSRPLPLTWPIPRRTVTSRRV